MPTGDIAWSASPSERINAAHGHMAIITRQAHLPPVIKLYLRRGGGGRDVLELAAEQLLYIALQELDPRVPLKVQRRSHRPQVPLDRTLWRQSDSDANLSLTSIYLGITIHATALKQRKRPVLRMNAPPCTAECTPMHCRCARRRRQSPRHSKRCACALALRQCGPRWWW